MKIYITLEDLAQRDDYSRLQAALSEIGYSVLGSYESRNCRTIVAEAEELETEVIAKIEHIKKSIPILEVGTSMKFYVVLNSGVRSADVNPKLRELLKKDNYEAIVYPSHSENGISYVGINIKDLNPLDVEQMNRCKQVIEQIEGINNLIIY